MSRKQVVPGGARRRGSGGGSSVSARRCAIQASDVLPDELYLRERAEYVAEATAALRDSVRMLRNSLEVEWTVSGFIAAWGDFAHTDRIQESGREFVDAFEDAGDASALVMLRGIEAVAQGRVRRAAAEAATRIAKRGVTVPRRMQHVGRAKALRAWTLGERSEADGIGVMIEYEYPDHERHTVAGYIADYLGGIVKFMSLTTGLEDLVDEAGAVAVPVPEASALLRTALVATEPRQRPPGEDGVRKLGALAWSRVGDSRCATSRLSARPRTARAPPPHRRGRRSVRRARARRLRR